MFAVPTNTWGGNWVWDQASSLWRSVAVNNSENAIYQYTSVDGYTSSAPTVAISPGTWDTSLGVPFIWNEAGQTRPWRMFYSNAGAKMGLATSLDGATWDKKDTAGNVLSAAVLTQRGRRTLGACSRLARPTTFTGTPLPRRGILTWRLLPTWSTGPRWMTVSRTRLTGGAEQTRRAPGITMTPPTPAWADHKSPGAVQTATSVRGRADGTDPMARSSIGPTFPPALTTRDTLIRVGPPPALTSGPLIGPIGACS